MCMKSWIEDLSIERKGKVKKQTSERKRVKETPYCPWTPDFAVISGVKAPISV